jgi:hypothetical protein
VAGCNQILWYRFVLAGNIRECFMGKPDSTNPSTKPQDDKKQSGTDPIGKTQNPPQQGQGRDPSKDQGHQKSSGDQPKQGGQDPQRKA